MNIWNKVRKWGQLRGIDKVDAQVQYQRVLQEVVEIHDAMVSNDKAEFQDAIGDTIVTLINLANTEEYAAELCLDGAFEVIEKRKGFTTKRGDFVRYGKLDSYSKDLCDIRQGNPDNEYYIDEPTKENFQWVSN